MNSFARSAAMCAALITLGCGDDDAASTSTGTGGEVGSGGQGAGGLGSGGAGGGGGGPDGDDLAALSDTFDDATLDSAWTVFNEAALDPTVSDGALQLTLSAPALWFQASQGTALFKTVTGSFSATARVRAAKTSAPSEPPDATIHLGGLMARDPASDDGQENYVFIVVGFDENDLSVETKSTTNDVSDYIGPTWPSAEAELRLCRVGDTFYLYKRALGGTTWEEAISYDRPDMPETLQVGPNAYSLSAPDLTVSFDEVTFARISNADDCTL